MKKIFTIIGIASLAFTSCSKDDTTNDISQQTVIKATFEQDDSSSRLNIADNNSLTWSTGDAFALFGNGSSAKFTLQGEGGSATGTFTGTTPSTILGAAFPYTSETNPSLSGSTLSMTLPAELNQADGKCNLPMWAATNSTENISFKHLAGVLRVELKNIPVGYESLIVTADKPISGTFTATTTDTTPVLASTSTADADKTLTVSFTAPTEATNSNTLYVPLPVGDYASIKISISNGATPIELITYTNKNVARAKINKAILTYSSATGTLATPVANPTELTEALEDGEPVILTDDIEISTPITISENKPTELNLNGKTLTFTESSTPIAMASATRSSEPSGKGIENSGNLTITNGEIIDNVNRYTIYNNGKVNLDNVKITANYIAIYNKGKWENNMTVQKYKGTDAAVKFTMIGGSITSTTEDKITNVYAVMGLDYCLIDIKNATITGEHTAGGIHLNCAEAKLDNVTINRGTEGTAHQICAVPGVLTYTNTNINNHRYYYGDSKGKYGYAEVNGVYYGEVNQIIAFDEPSLTAALTNVKDGGNVKLIDSFSASNQISFNNPNKTFTINLNDKILTLGATYGLVNKAGKLVIENGDITGNCSYTTLCNWVDSNNNNIETVLNDVDVTASYIGMYSKGVWAENMTLQQYKGTNAVVKFTMSEGSITSTTEVKDPNAYTVMGLDYCLIDIKNATITGEHTAGGIHLNCAEAKLDNVTINRGTEGTAHQVCAVPGILTYTNTDINNYRYYYGDSKGKYGYAEVNGTFYGEVNQVVEVEDK